MTKDNGERAQDRDGAKQQETWVQAERAGRGGRSGAPQKGTSKSKKGAESMSHDESKSIVQLQNHKTSLSRVREEQKSEVCERLRDALA